jgi:YHS domain-containing protein
MAVGTNLVDRIEAEFAKADKRVKELQSQQVGEFQGRQHRLEKIPQILEHLREIWRPRLEALAKKFGERVDVKPTIEPGKRGATFEFKSELARIKLRFAVSPDNEARNLVFTSDLEIIPILMKFDSHDEIEFPFDAVDEAALGKWFDDRIVSFVQTYLALNENQYYLKGHMVEDPVAKVQFPKYAAGATLDVDGKTLYFIDETTLREFQEKKAAK